MNTYEFFKNFKAILPEDYEKINGYTKTYLSKRKYQRFFLSHFILNKYTKVGEFFYTIVDDCLLIVRKKWVYEPTLIFTNPPIHKFGKKIAERTLMLKIMRMGLKFKISEEDVKYYNFTRKHFKINVLTKEAEFIYDDTFRIMENIKYKSRKSIRRDLTKANFKIIGTPTKAQYEDMYDLFKDWMVKKETKLNMFNGILQKECIDKLKNYKFILLYEPDTDVLSSFSLIEKIDDGYYIEVSRIFRYSNDTWYRDRSRLMHYLMVNNVPNEDIFLISNGSGAQISKQLHFTKAKLQPVKLLSLYKITIKGVKDVKFNKAEYETMCKSTERYDNIPEMMII